MTEEEELNKLVQDRATLITERQKLVALQFTALSHLYHHIEQYKEELTKIERKVDRKVQFGMYRLHYFTFEKDYDMCDGYMEWRLDTVKLEASDQPEGTKYFPPVKITLVITPTEITVAQQSSLVVPTPDFTHWLRLIDQHIERETKRVEEWFTKAKTTLLRDSTALLKQEIAAMKKE